MRERVPDAPDWQEQLKALRENDAMEDEDPDEGVAR
jgi:hypothetical protein